MIPGEVVPAADSVEINPGGQLSTLRVTNTSPYPVHITAHFHLFEANPRLKFDRQRAFGMRLATHAKGAVRIEAGEQAEIVMTPISGDRIVRGFQGVVEGPLDSTDMDAALAELLDRGFLHQPKED